MAVNYSLVKVEEHDEEWAQDCQEGSPWEMLSWKMDVEEPEAAHAQRDEARFGEHSCIACSWACLRERR